MASFSNAIVIVFLATILPCTLIDAACTDNASFTFTTASDKSKDCTWLSKSTQRIERYCNSSHERYNHEVYKNCPLTCSTLESVSYINTANHLFPLLSNQEKMNSCSWITSSLKDSVTAKRVNKYCTFQQQMINCPATCGCKSTITVEDETAAPSPSSTRCTDISDSYEFDAIGDGKGPYNCAWITQSPKPEITQKRKGLYCTPEQQLYTCAGTCGLCDTTPSPTATKTTSPTVTKTTSPTGTTPTISPSRPPSPAPSPFPTLRPTSTPSDSPTRVPSISPTDLPSVIPSDLPSNIPSDQPSLIPSDIPSMVPSSNPTLWSYLQGIIWQELGYGNEDVENSNYVDAFNTAKAWFIQEVNHPVEKLDGNHTGYLMDRFMLSVFYNQNCKVAACIDNLSWNFTIPVEDHCNSGWTGIDCDANNRTTYIGLSGKSLSGELPLLKMDELIHFIVHNNALSGTIPTMDGLSKVEYLSLFNNQFTGTLPQLILPRLQSFYLTDNELDVVPDLTSTCPNLSFYFNIARNRGDLTVHQNMCNAFPDDHISVLTGSGSLTCASF